MAVGVRRSYGPGWRAVLLAGTALTIAPAALHAQAPTARPQGGAVVAGQASISQSAAATTVTQSSQRAIVEWQGFNVGSAHSVTFAQPGSSAVVLNRVTGPDPSAIAGRISANGQVVIINRNGVVFSEGARVDAAGLVVSTANIANRDFMAGRMNFSEPGKPGARIENRGTITIKEAGIAALVAPQVANSGVIRAQMGRVVLAGAETHTVDLYGDGLVSLDVSSQVRRTADGGTALVTNTGMIEADGGTVLLTATAAEGLVSTLVRAGGRISADNPAGTAGTIALRGSGGELRVEGVVTATGARGGQVAAVADRVTVAAGAHVDASGRSGGGRIDIGETRPGSAAPQTAQRVRIERGATVTADATVAGPGGTVRVMADTFTTHAGAITARGGPQGGDGGFVEVSSRGGMNWSGTVDVSAALGAAGTILLDPKDIQIVAGGAGEQDDGLVTVTGPDGSLPAGTNPADDPNRPVLITTGLLNSLTGNVVLEATDTITVSAAISRSGNLTLTAGGAITINATVASSGGVRINAGSISIGAAVDGGAGGVVLVAGGTVNVGAQLQGSLISVSGSGIMLAAPVVATGGGAVTLAAAAGGIGQGTAGTITAGQLTLTSQGTINLPEANSIAALSFSTTGNNPVRVNAVPGYLINGGSTTAGSVHLSSGGGLTLGAGVSIGGSAVTLEGQGLGLNGNITASGGLVTLNAGGGDLGHAAGIISGGGLALTAGGLIALSGGALSTGGTLNVVAGGVLTQVGGSVAAGVLTGSAGGAVSLRTAGNSIGIVSNFGGTGDFGLHAGDRALTVIGLGTRGNVYLAARQITLSGGLAATTRISFNTDAVGAPSIAAPTVEIGPYAGGVVQIGTGGFNPFVLVATNLTLGSAEGVTSASAINIDAALNVPGVLTLRSTGQIAQTAAISAGALNASGSGIVLDNFGNTIAALQAMTSGSAAQVRTAGSLLIQGAVSAPGTVTLDAGGAIGTAGGSITAGTLTGSAGAGADFGSGNTVGTFGPFNAGIGALTFGNTGAFTLAGAIEADQAITLGNASGAITQTSASGNVITTPLLGIGQSGSLSLAGANQITRFGNITSGGSITLRSTDILLAGHVSTPGAVQLTSGGGLVRLDPGGRISAGTLSLSALFGATLDNPANAIGALGNVSVLLGSATIRTGGDVTVTGLVEVGGTLTLHAGAIGQSGTGRIVTGRLQGSASAIALANGNNAIASLGAFGSVSGDVEVATAGDMTVAGATSAANLRLSTAGLLTVDDDIAATGTVALSVGTFVIGTTGSVTAPVVALAPRSPGSVVIGNDPSAALQIDAANLSRITASSVLRIGAPTTDPGDITATSINIASAAALGGVATLDLRTTGNVTGGGLTTNRVTGSVGGSLLLNAGFGNIGTLGDLTVGGDLAVSNIGVLDLAGTILVGGAVNLTSFSGVTQSAGSLSASQLSVATFSGPVSLGQPGNAIGTLTSANVGGMLTLSSAGALALQGNIIASTLAINAGGPITQSSASGNAISAQHLQGTASGGISLLGANTIGQLGDIAAGGAFSLRNLGSLVLVGHLDAGASAARFDMSGTLSESGVGRLTAGVLEGTVGSLSLGSTGNAIASVGDLTLTSGNALLRTSGALAVAGHLNAAGRTVTLHAGGAVTQGASGRLSAGLLEGSAVSLALDGTGNAVTTLGNYAATGSLSLATTTGLTLAGTVTATDTSLTAAGAIGQSTSASITSGSLRLDAGGPVTLLGPNRIGDLAGLVAGGDVTLTNVQALRIAAPVSLSGRALTLALGGPLTQTGAGTVAVGRLTGSVTGALTLDNAGNQIARAGGLTATGPVSLATGGSLVLDGTLTATGQPVSLAATGAITQGVDGIVAGSLAVSAGAGFALTGANNVAVLGDASSGTGDASLRTIGPLALAGHLDAGTRALALDIGGALTTAGGHVTAGRLTGSAGSVTLDAATNDIARIGDLAAGGDIIIATADAIVLDGALTAPGHAVRIDAGGALTQVSTPGTAIVARHLEGSAIGGMSLPGANVIGQLGDIAAGGAFSLRNLGSLALVGHLDAGSSTATFDVSGTLSGTGAGRLTAGVLEGVVGSLSLDALGNAIAAVGDLAVTSGDALLRTGGDLEIAGHLDAPGRTVTLHAGGAVTQGTSGRLTAALLEGSAASLALDGAGNAVAALGDYAVTGSLSLATTTDLALTGAVSATDVSLTTAGAMSQTASAFIASDTLSLEAGGGVALLGPNMIDDLAGLVAGGDVVLTNAQALRITAPVSLAGHELTLAIDGALTQTGAGTVEVDRLTGSVTGALTLDNAGNQIARVGGLTATGPVTLATNGSLLLDGTLMATGQAVSLTATGAITQGADGIVADSLSVSAGSGFALTGANDVAVLGDASSGTGDASLRTIGSLALAGHLDAGGHTLALDIGGALTTSGGRVTAERLTGSAGSMVLDADANDIARIGDLVAPGDITIATANATILDGVVQAATLSLRSGGALTQQAGHIEADTLLLDTGGAATLGGPNLIGALGNSRLRGALVLTETDGLALTGHVDATGQDVRIATGGALTATGGRLSAATLAGSFAGLSLTGANAIGALGDIASTGDVTLVNGGALLLAGHLNAPGRSVALGTLAGGIGTGPAGRITADLFRTPDAGSTGSIVLTGANAVARLGPIELRGGDLAFASTAPLLLVPQGVQINVDGSVTLTATLGAMTIAGPIAAGGTITLAAPQGPITVTAPSLFAGAGGIAISALAVDSDATMTAGGDIDIEGTQSLAIRGSLGAGGAITLAALQGPVTIAAPSLFAGAGGITISGLTVDSDAAMTAGGGIDIEGTQGLAIRGSLAAGGTITLAALQGPMTITAPSLTAGAGDIVLSALTVESDAAMTAGGDIDIEGTQGLAIRGSLAAGRTITLAALLGPLTITAPSLTAGAGDILINGLTVESDARLSAGGDVDVEGKERLVIGNRLEAGGVIMLSAPDMKLDGVDARGQALYLELFGGVVNGSVDAGRLVLVGLGGIGSMTGSVGGIGGQAAATRVEREALDGTKLPATPDDRKLLMNGCPVRTINCSVIPGASAIPPGSPLRDVAIMAAQTDDDDEDVQLPGVAARDY